MAFILTQRILLVFAWRQVNLCRFWRQKLAIFLGMLLLWSSISFVAFHLRDNVTLQYVVEDTAVLDRPCDIKLRRDCAPIGNADCDKEYMLKAMTDKRLGIETPIAPPRPRNTRVGNETGICF